MRFFFLSNDKMVLIFLLFCVLVLISALYCVYAIDKVNMSNRDKVDEIENYIHSPTSLRRDSPKADLALNYMVIEFHNNRDENALLSILKLYLFGLNPHYSPNKITGLKLIQLINDNNNHFSKTLLLHCDVLWEQTSVQTYNDPDMFGSIELPDNIVEKIHLAIEHQRCNNIQLKPCSTQCAQYQEHPQEVEDNEYYDIADVVYNDVRDDDVRDDDVRDNAAFRSPIKSDSQNVHNLSIPNSVHRALEQIVALNSSNHIGTFQEAFQLYQRDLKAGDCEIDDNVRSLAMQVVQSFTCTPHSKFKLSEQQVFVHVYTRLANSENKASLINLLTNNLASAVEYESVVCSTGKITRMVSTFDVVDDEIPDLKPDWVLKEEISAIAAKTRADVLKESEPQLISDYEKNQDSVVCETMKGRFINEIKERYVDKGILSEAGLTLLSADYLDAF